MSIAARITLLVLVFDAVALAAVELLYLPLRVGAVPVPVTILLAVVSTRWLVRSAAELGGPRSVAAVPLVVWLLALGVFGVAGPGGDVLLPADWRSLLLLGGGLFPAALVLGRTLARPAVATSASGGVAGRQPVAGDTVQVDGPPGYRE
ncbi:MAG: hypothetical protein ACRDRY_02115 [Pseudonocardiaceae bacterium]